ncbi:hypothetical protein QBC34DRAFT_427211 [Podospora aff. communis PSN243]|uniref:Uncharacterized protein n=1 Tax=Podospora aff. communis PSN243 TaxID=3040156 RepID=A0AAV9GGZ9_9PEZI|nr:hypothetical protein QBC34DRAFT_427211 [Podospora aff. communis PSN243]
MSSTWTLWTLPAQAAPKSDVKYSTFVTIWAFACVLFAVLFHRKLSSPTPVWPEFKSIGGSTVLLAVWYTGSAVDRWLHYDQCALSNGYILFEPILKVLQVISTIWFLWGTYSIVWQELERRFEGERLIGKWWFAAKVAIFIVGLTSFYYVVLDVATAVVWLQFLSLNIISDVATKRNNFELAMTASFTVFGILTMLAVVATIFIRARKREGSWAKTRVYLVIATAVLLFRSMSECILVAMVHNGSLLRIAAQVSYDIAYGVLTCVYLAFMYLQACQLVSKLDMGAEPAEKVRSDVRAWILDRLRTVTQNHVLTAPALSSILDEASAELAQILEHGPLSLASDLTAEKKTKVARDYVKQLRRESPRFVPQPKTMPDLPQLASNGRIRRVPVGRQSAPPMPSSSAYESLRSSSNPEIRKPSSVPDMRANRFAPRGLGENPLTGSGQWQPNVALIEEHQPQAAYTPAQPFGNDRFAPAATNAPSFSQRVEAAGFVGGQGQQQQRRRFGPQGGGNTIPEAGLGQDQEYPPESYAPQPQAYPAQSPPQSPAQSYSPQPSPQEYPPASQEYVPQYAPPVEAQAARPPAQRRRFEPTRDPSVPSVPFVPQGVQVPLHVPQAEFPPQPPSMFQSNGRSRQVYAETVTDSEVASTRSPVNFDYALPDLGQLNPPG